MKPWACAWMVLAVVCLGPAGGGAAQFDSAEFPGLAKIYLDTAPSDLDRWLEKQIKSVRPPSSPHAVIIEGLKMMAYPGLAGYEAERGCAERGIITGYSLGAAAGLWGVNATAVKNELWLRASAGGMAAGCARAHMVHFNVALSRGYLEAIEIPAPRRRILRDLLTAHIEEDRSWEVGFTDRRLPFYTTYAKAFQKYLARPS